MAGSPSPDPPLLLPEHIGPFRILRLLGEGSSGRVYLAEQCEPRREIALKVLRSASLSGEALRRFRREAELLAQLEHPSIARLYAAGVAESDAGPLPYLAMEYVRGADLLNYARDQALDLRAKLALLADVCRAVHFAHTRGIVHRDLKPANVLVDAAGTPHVLDFGVAHFTQAEGGAEFTVAGQVLGTVPYMSPEALVGSTGSGDPRSDVYSLGVVAYELLSGDLPYPGLNRSTVIEAIAIVRSGRPERLGKRLPEAKGDIETVVMKAMAGEAVQRYGSAAELAADLERILEHRPIEARPPTASYVMGLFVRRHRALSAAVVLSAVALMTAAGVSLRFAFAEQQARSIAESRSAELSAINDFLVRMISASDPEQAQGAELSMRDVLDSARATLGADLPPSVAVQLRRALAQTYLSLGASDEALTQIDAANQLATDDPHVEVELALLHGQALRMAGKLAESEQELRALLTRIDANPELAADGATHIQTTHRLAEAILELGRTDEARALLKEDFDKSGQILGKDHPLTLTIGNDLAIAIKQGGDAKAALKLQEELVAAHQQGLGSDHPDTLSARINLGNFHSEIGDTAQAETIYRDVLERRNRVLGPQHILTLSTKASLATFLAGIGKPAEALPLAQQALEAFSQHYGENNRHTLMMMNVVAYTNEDLGRLGDAEKIYREILRIQTSAPGDNHPEAFPMRNNLAMLLLDSGRTDEAAQEFDILMKSVTAALGEDHPYTAVFRSNYGLCLLAQHRYQASIDAQLRSIPVLESRFGATHGRTQTAYERLRDAYLAAGDTAHAQEAARKIAANPAP